MANPQNPYQPDPDQEPHFVGRRDIFQIVEAELRAPERNAVLLHGAPRMGKTCLLRELQRRLPSPPFLPCYFDLRDRVHQPLGRLLYDLAQALSAEVQMDAPVEADFGHIPHFQAAFLPAFYRALPPDYRPVILLDSFDLPEVIAEKLPQGAAGAGPPSAAHLFPPYLHSLMEAEPRLSFVFGAARRTEDFSTDVQALLRTAREKHVGALDEQSARALVRLAEERGSLHFAEGSVERVLSLTARHPYLIQLVCYTLFRRAHSNGGGVPIVNSQEVEAVTRAVLDAGEPFFETLWGTLSAPERVVLSTLAESADEGDAVTDESMHQMLQRHGLRILTREMELAPEALVKREILSRGPHGYQFQIELLRRYVALRRPPAEVEGERQKIVPAANAMYHSAVAAQEGGKLAEARDLLERTLRKNPNLVQARVRLGQVLQEQGQLDEARRELEEALKYAPEEAKKPLIRTLLLLGEALERAGADLDKEERALVAYQRALELNPREPVAQERARAILRQRGERAQRAGDLDRALQLYEQAGAADKAAEVQSHKRSGQVERVMAEALQHEARGEWAEAYAIYQRLAADEPTRWQAELRRTEVEHLLVKHYGEAQQALALQRWPQALRHLGEVVALRPEYKDAAQRLHDAAQALVRGQQRERGGVMGRLRALPAAAVWGPVCAGLVGLLVVQGVWLRRPAGDAPVAGTQVAGTAGTPGAPGTEPGPAGVSGVSADGLSGMPPLRAGGPGVAGAELAQQGIQLAATGELDKAQNFLRQAYRNAADARWLYDLGVLHDRAAQIGPEKDRATACDEAAFFYRAAVLGKGVQKEDLDLLNGRLSALEEQCHFKARQSTAADRHRRAGKFMDQELCALAQSVLTGIVTAEEKARLLHCSGAHAESMAVADKPKKKVEGGGGGGRGPGPGADLPSLLSVTAKPWADVLLDGQKVGRTPLDGFRIPPGKHTVTLVNDDMNGRQSYPVNAVPGNTYTITYSWQR